MTSLTRIEHNDVFTDSLIIAENIGREHASVTYNIKKFRARFEKMGPLYSSATRINERGRPAQVYSLNEAQAVFLMTLMDNSERVLDFKMALSMEFVRMRRVLIERQTVDWQTARLEGKKARLQETSAIKELVEYAKAQGSKNADKLYMTYSKLVKSLAGYETRDTTGTETLEMVAAFERILTGVITKEMAQNTHYKQIYQRAKQQLNSIKELWIARQMQLLA